MKHYCILAINRNDPTDILGYADSATFEMEWSNERVHAYHYDSKDGWLGMPAREHWKEFLRFFGFNGAPPSVKGRFQNYKRRMLLHGGSGYAPCGRTGNEYEWNFMRHYLLPRCTPPEGYEARVFRIGSKWCPVEVDFSERDPKNPRFDNFIRNNPRFSIIR